MAESDGKQNFWTTIPGILTGIAALLTAATGFFAVYHAQNSATSTDHAAQVTSGPETKAAQQSSTSSPAVPSATPSQNPTAKQSVTLTSRAGDTANLLLKSFRHNYTDDAVELTSGQTISFEKIRSIDFFTVNGDDHQVAVKVTLTDGRVVDGELKTNYAFKGESDIGPFTIFVQDVKQIVFNR